MNKEQQELLDEAYKNYLKDLMRDNVSKDDPNYILLSKEEFVNKCKTDTEFSENWGLKIEERELSLEERRALVTQEMFNQIYNGGGPESLSHSEINQWNIPTKLITITYKDTIIESYE